MFPARNSLHPKPLQLAGCFTALVFWLMPARVQAERPQPDLEAGKAAYGQYCARCHGETGKGDGVDAKRFYPRPRDLSLGKYKFRTTATGTAPSDGDLFRTITYGLPGSNMPDWQHLDAVLRWQLVEYLKSFSPAFQETLPEAVQLPADPGHKSADLKKGRQVYEQLGCAACHGTTGRADGSSAAGLVDEWGMPIRPVNLTQGWAYRGGRTAADIVMRVLAGIDGSGMPSYAGAIMPPEDVWQMAYYVESLQEPAHWNMIVHALPLHAALPEKPDDAVWRQAESTTLRLRNVVTPEGEWQHPPTLHAVMLQVAYNNEAVAFKLSWDDPTQDPPAVLGEDQTAAPDPDALAVMLKTAGSPGDKVTLQAWPYAGAPTLDASFWSAKTREAFGAGINRFEELSEGRIARTLLTASAGYDNGRWSVVIQRPLKLTEAADSAAIDLKQFTGVAFAVWDGGNNNARAVSPWVDVVFERNVTAH